MPGKITNHFYPLILVLLLGALVILIARFSGPPIARDTNTPSDQFSSARAFEHLEHLLAENLPHPTGSAANNVILQRIWDKFTEIGLQPELQSGLSCSAEFPGCAEVQNIIVIQRGTSPANTRKAIMLATHYDSVAASAGAGDDGAGIAATLEIARILAAGPPLANDVIYLLTDAEETGLRGAQLFTDKHPLMGQVGLVINLEARGVTGASSMFETGPNNQKIIEVFAKAIARPAANSLSYEIYQRMPNDTDFSVYKAAGVQGLNFAFAGGVSLYHSSRDSLANLDQNSLQHHGDNALSLIRAFGDQDLTTLQASGNATYFDLFTTQLIVWPSLWNIPATVVLLLLLSMVIFRKLEFRGRSLIIVISAMIGVIALPIIAGWLLSFPLGKWPQTHPLDHPYPWPGRLALLGAALLIAMSAGKLAVKWVSPKAILLASYWLMAALAFAVAVLVSGASYMLLLPVALFGFGLSIDLLIRSDKFIFGAHLGLLGASYMALYHFFLLELVAGFQMSHFKMLPLILLVLALTPLFARHWQNQQTRWRAMFIGTTSSIAIFALIASLLPGYTTSRPRGQNLVLIENTSTGTAEWISEAYGGQDQDFLLAADFPMLAAAYNLYGIFETNRVFKPVKLRNLPAPEFRIVSDEMIGETRTISIEISSPRKATILAIGFAKDKTPDSVKINDQLAARFDADAPRIRRLIPIHGPKNTPYLVTIKTKDTNPFPITLLDQTPLLAAQTRGLSKLRPNDSAPIHRGDRSISIVQFEVISQ